jgi:hypothetical protein
MRIPLQVYDFAGGLRIMAHLLLKAEEPHIFGSIRAIVDTGSPATIIGNGDAERMRVSKIQLKNLETPKNPVAIGGGRIVTKIVKNADVQIGTDFKSGPMDILVPFQSDEGGSCQPTILGVDFMERNRLRLFFDPINKEAYFDTIE